MTFHAGIIRENPRKEAALDPEPRKRYPTCALLTLLLKCSCSVYEKQCIYKTRQEGRQLIFTCHTGATNIECLSSSVMTVNITEHFQSVGFHRALQLARSGGAMHRSSRQRPPAAASETALLTPCSHTSRWVRDLLELNFLRNIDLISGTLA